MKFILMLMACFDYLGTRVTFTECPRDALLAEECRAHVVDRLRVADIEAEMKYVYEKRGWVRSTCGK